MGANAPDADPRMGEAALLSSQTGREMMRFMQRRGEEMAGWARADRQRYLTQFRPLEQQFINDARTWNSNSRREARASEAAGDVMLASRLASQQRARQASAMGVDPRSGRFRDAEARAGMDTALAAAGARNTARRAVEQEGQAMRANAINLGQGSAINPGSLMGAATSTTGQGFQGAMQGYGQQADILNASWQQQMQAYQQQQSGLTGLFQGIGMLGGAFLSSKGYKTDKEPVGDALGAIRSMPVEQWRYKEGIADGGAQPHVGPYAEDFKAATGKGDGKSIPAQDAVGLTMAAVQQLADKVDALAMGAVSTRKAA